MFEYKNLIVSLEDGVALIELNRPEKLNALNAATFAEISNLLQIAASDDQIKALIFTGSGPKAFGAGADILEFEGVCEQKGAQISADGQAIFSRIENFGKPVIAVVHGYALGGGCELALACHIRIASENAKIGLPEASLGLVPGYGATQRLPLLVGKGRALEMMMSGQPIDAAEAYRIGLVNKVLADKAAAIQAARELLKVILTKAPGAIASIITLANTAHIATDFALEAAHFGQRCISQDCKEGISAFMEKRPARFTGQ